MSSCKCVPVCGQITCQMSKTSQNDLIMNSTTMRLECISHFMSIWTVLCSLDIHTADKPIVRYFPFSTEFAVWKSVNNTDMQKIHQNTYTQSTWVSQVVEPFDECQKGCRDYKRISRIWLFVVREQPIWKSKCRRGIMRLSAIEFALFDCSLTWPEPLFGAQTAASALAKYYWLAAQWDT